MHCRKAHNLLFLSCCTGCLCHWMEAFTDGFWKLFFPFFSPCTHKDLAAEGQRCVSNTENTVGRYFRTVLCCFCSKGHDRNVSVLVWFMWAHISLNRKHERFIEWWWTMEATSGFLLKARPIQLKSRLLGALSSQVLAIWGHRSSIFTEQLVSLIDRPNDSQMRE